MISPYIINVKVYRKISDIPIKENCEIADGMELQLQKEYHTNYRFNNEQTLNNHMKFLFRKILKN